MGREYVGIDFHRRRSVIVRMNEAGERLAVERVANEPALIAAAVGAAGRTPEVVIESTYGWYWIVDLLQELGATVHLANPNALNWGERRVKNDVVDATDLADMLRMGRLPEAWIAPPALRELRELVRYRAKLVQLRSGLKAQVHAVMAKQGVLPGVVDMFGPAGQVQLDEAGFDGAYLIRVRSLRELISATTPGTGRCRRSTESGARSPRSWSPRSVTCHGSQPPGICARGPGSPPAAASPTARATTPGSRNRARSCCAGR
jgi:transposase